MRFVFRKDVEKRNYVVRFEKRVNFYKSLARSNSLFVDAFVFYKICLQFKKPFIVQLKNRCQFTFSKHSINRFYHLGRNAFRSSASFVSFFGLQKASW